MSGDRTVAARPAKRETAGGPHRGALIINADDWGRDRDTTTRILECVAHGTVSSVSAMVFMGDSERAAEVAREHGVDAGLHINFTTRFSGPRVPSALARHQELLGRQLLWRRFAPVVFYPWLCNSFRYVVAAQTEEFARLYGEPPGRVDGHHHMHLCANVILQRLLPHGAIARRNFTFQRGEKQFWNRMYRRVLDKRLQRRNRISDFMFDLLPLEPEARVKRIFALARRFAVEVETHPVRPEEYRFLTGGEALRIAGDIPVAPGYRLC